MASQEGGRRRGGLAARARPDRRARARARARHPGLPGQAVPDPVASRWSRRWRSASACSSTASATTSATRRRRHRRLPPAGRRRARQRVRRRPAAAPARSCDKPTPQRADVELHQADRRRPGRHASRSATATSSSTASCQKEPFIKPCGGGEELQLPDRRSRFPPDHYFMMGDNRGVVRRQPLLGTRPARMDHRRGLRHLLAARPHRPPLRTPAAQPRARRAQRRAGSSASTARSACRFVAGADEAGRGCLAGPLVAAAVLFDYERLSLRDRARAAALNDSKQHTAEAREELYPRVLRAAARVAVVVALRARDRRARPARDQPRGAPRRAARASRVAGLHLPVATASRCRATRLRAARRGRRRRDQRRDRRRLGHRQGHARPLHAARRRSATRAGSSRRTSATRRPSTARRSSGSGVSPLHRLSFQSVAYQQLAL